MAVKSSVIIPTWNGLDLLKANLPTVLDVVPDDCEVIVVENGSEDASMEYLQKLTRQRGDVLTVIKNDRNLGFIGGCNQGVKEAEGEFVVLLNNDVVPRKNFLEPALEHFEDKDIFAVSFNEVNGGGWADIFWTEGYFNYLPGADKSKPHISGWASGGSAVFRKSMWNKLDGLDELYAPFFWEDLDLSYRGWKMGWKIIWEPKAKVVHEHESTISKINQNYVNRVKERNQLLFIWKNITDADLKFKHNLGLIQRVLTGPNYLKVIVDAKKRYRKFGHPKIKDYKLSDKEIFRLFDQ